MPAPIRAISRRRTADTVSGFALTNSFCDKRLYDQALIARGVLEKHELRVDARPSYGELPFRKRDLQQLDRGILIPKHRLKAGAAILISARRQRAPDRLLLCRRIRTAKGTVGAPSLTAPRNPWGRALWRGRAGRISR
jgi:hypothetical protein